MIPMAAQDIQPLAKCRCDFFFYVDPGGCRIIESFGYLELVGLEFGEKQKPDQKSLRGPVRLRSVSMVPSFVSPRPNTTFPGFRCKRTLDEKQKQKHIL